MHIKSNGIAAIKNHHQTIVKLINQEIHLEIVKSESGRKIMYGIGIIAINTNTTELWYATSKAWKELNKI